MGRCRSGERLSPRSWKPMLPAALAHTPRYLHGASAAFSSAAFRQFSLARGGPSRLRRLAEGSSGPAQTFLGLASRENLPPQVFAAGAGGFSFQAHV